MCFHCFSFSFFFFRKLQPHNSQLKSPQSNHSFHKTPGDSPSQLSPAKTVVIIHTDRAVFLSVFLSGTDKETSSLQISRVRTSPSCTKHWSQPFLFCPFFQKRTLLPDPLNCQTPKKQKLSDQCLPQQSPCRDYHTNGSCSSSKHRNTSTHIKVELDKTNNHFQSSPNGLYSPHKPGGLTTTTTPKQERTGPTSAPAVPRPTLKESICTVFTNSQHKKKRSKKHKDKERERLKEDWIETSPDLKQNQENLKGKCHFDVRVLPFIKAALCNCSNPKYEAWIIKTEVLHSFWWFIDMNRKVYLRLWGTQ